MNETGRSILLDTNLLLLLVVGLFDPDLIGRRRLDGFTLEDFQLLQLYTAPFQHSLTTPHVLAELNNLSDQCVPSNRHNVFREFLHDFIPKLDEKWTPAVELTKTDAFLRLGLADAAVCQLAEKQTAVVLSADVHLYVLLLERGVNVTNFNHLRNY